MKNTETNALGTEKISKLFWKLATPAIAAQVINLLYNLVDRMYIGHMEPVETVGRLALTGVGLCLPLITIISAFAALFGTGAAPLASIRLGRGDKEGAEQVLGNSVTALVTLSVILTAVILLWTEEILYAFGASPDTIAYAVDYMRIYAIGTLFVQLTLGLNPFISGQGFSKISMLTVLIGAVTNIILDPIFIYGLNMGVKGAATATALSQCLSMLWSVKFLTGKKTTICIKKRYLKPNRKIIFSSMALGVSPFIMQSTESLVAICFNTSLLKYGGDMAVGAMTILTSSMQFCLLPLQGLAQGAQPIISYNFGAKKPDRVRGAFRILLISSLTYTSLYWVGLQFFPEVFVKLFNNDPDLVVFASRALRIYTAGVLIFGAQVACQNTFMALGNAKNSLFLALLRKIILLIPLIYILPNFFVDKTTAVFIAEPIADILAATTTVIMFTITFKKTMKSIS
ncbi:MAG: MATE family efflux transporter [Eubacteriales bacterium]